MGDAALQVALETPRARETCTQPPTSGTLRLQQGVAYLRLRETKAAGQLLPLSSHHVVILFEGSLQPQQLRGREGRADPLGLACEGPV